MIEGMFQFIFESCHRGNFIITLLYIFVDILLQFSAKFREIDQNEIQLRKSLFLKMQNNYLLFK